VKRIVAVGEDDESTTFLLPVKIPDCTEKIGSEAKSVFKVPNVLLGNPGVGSP